jgi:hypothetical protein
VANLISLRNFSGIEIVWDAYADGGLDCHRMVASQLCFIGVAALK